MSGRARDIPTAPETIHRVREGDEYEARNGCWPSSPWGYLAAGLSVGAGFARGGLSDGDGDGDSTKSTFISKVASILELDEDTVSDAFEQARSEMADEKVEAMLDAKVEKGSYYPGPGR